MNDSLLFQWKREDILKFHRSKCFHKKYRIHYFLFDFFKDKKINKNSPFYFMTLTKDIQMDVTGSIHKCKLSDALAM